MNSTLCIYTNSQDGKNLGESTILKLVDNSHLGQYVKYPIDIVKFTKGMTPDPTDDNSLWNITYNPTDPQRLWWDSTKDFDATYLYNDDKCEWTDLCPSNAPSAAPSLSAAPSSVPSNAPSAAPSSIPSTSLQCQHPLPCHCNPAVDHPNFCIPQQHSQTKFMSQERTAPSPLKFCSAMQDLTVKVQLESILIRKHACSFGVPAPKNSSGLERRMGPRALLLFTQMRNTRPMALRSIPQTEKYFGQITVMEFLSVMWTVRQPKCCNNCQTIGRLVWLTTQRIGIFISPNQRYEMFQLLLAFIT